MSEADKSRDTLCQDFQKLDIVAKENNDSSPDPSGEVVPVSARGPGRQLNVLCDLPRELRYTIFPLFEVLQDKRLQLDAFHQGDPVFREIQVLSGVCRRLREEIMRHVFTKNTFRMSLHASQITGDCGPFILGRKGMVGPTDLFAPFLSRIKHLEIHQETGDASLWYDVDTRAGKLLAEAMPQLEELVVYALDDETHLTEAFRSFLKDVMKFSAVKTLVFFDTYDVAEEDDFRFARGPPTCRFEVVSRTGLPIDMTIHPDMTAHPTCHKLEATFTGRPRVVATLPKHPAYSFMGLNLVAEPRKAQWETKFVV